MAEPSDDIEDEGNGVEENEREGQGPADHAQNQEKDQFPRMLQASDCELTLYAVQLAIGASLEH